jgi:hypothetical protein
MNILRWISLGAFAAIVAACGGGGGIGGTGGTAQGTMRVHVTDAPACGYDEVNVTIEKVRVHQDSTAGDGDGGWSEVVLDPARRVDLLSLTNGVLEELGETPLPAGRYTQLRLVLADNTAAAPFANSVVPTGGSEVALDTPSAQQSGLKMNVNIDVPADKVVDVVLDFDACKSVVKRGNSGRYNLKPVVSVIPLLSDAGLRVVGWVTPAVAATAPSVSVQASGVPVKATVPDPVTGRFVLYPVPVGTYDLVIGASGRVTSVMTGVPVVDTGYTYVNAESLPIAPAVAASAPRAVDGTVAPLAVAPVASVRALQRFSTGPTVEVASAAVDPDTGAFAFSLPVDAPRKTAYAGVPGTQPAAPVTFTADLPRAGLYTIEAMANGVMRTEDIDASAPVPPINFVFP